MRIGRLLLSALAAFLVFAPGTFLWHTVLFESWYIGPTFSVKSPDALSPPFLVAAFALLMVGMAGFIPGVVGATNRLRGGAIAGSIFASVVINFHSLELNGLFPGIDPASLYLMDTAWGAVFGAIAGVVVIAVNDRLARSDVPQRAAVAS